MFSFIAAAAVAMSAVASPVSAATYSFGSNFLNKDSADAETANKANANLAQYGYGTDIYIPKTDGVNVGLDMRLKQTAATSDNYTYAEMLEQFKSQHDTEGNALSVTLTSSSREKLVDGIASLNMLEVAKEWDAYIKAGVELAKSVSYLDESTLRDTAIRYANLSLELNVKIDVTNTDGNAVFSNADLEDMAKSGEGFTWSDVVVGDTTYAFDDLFQYVSENYEVNGNTKTFQINMKLREYEIDGSDPHSKYAINSRLDKYFSDIINADKNGDDANVYNLILSIPDNVIGTYGSSGKYRVCGTLTGNVKIAVPGIGGEHIVYFGTEADNMSVYNAETFDAKAVDTEYINIKTSSGTPGGGGGVTTPKPLPEQTTEPGTPTNEPISVPTATPMPDPQTGGTSNGAQLNYDDHYAYIIGYPDENGGDPVIVKPTANITRAEVATIFFRMMTDESRAKFWTTENDFPDVATGDWFNNAVSTATNAGILKGYDDGYFRPNESITRAEFAAIASRFTLISGDAKFSDIVGHWAEQNIKDAAATGWIKGYEDGSFKPNNRILRAEAMTLINRILYRIVEESSLMTDGALTWNDNQPGTWYYADVQEATNSHDYDRDAIGSVETWTGMRTPRDWAALEKETSDASSAGK